MHASLKILFVTLLAALQIQTIAPSFAQTSSTDNMPLTEKILSSPSYSGAQLSPSGKYVASLFHEGAASSVRVIKLPGGEQVSAPLLLDSKFTPGVIFFGSDKDDLFIFARTRENQPALLKADIAAGKMDILAENFRTSFSNVSSSNGYRFPLISIADAENPTLFRVWDQQRSQLTVVEASGGVRPVAVLPNNMPGYIGQKRLDASYSWVFVAKDGKQTMLATFSSSLYPDLAELVSVYQGSDRKYKAALLSAEDSDAVSLLEVDLETGKRRILKSDAADIPVVSLSPQTMAPDSVKTDYLKPEWQALGSDTASFFKKLDELPGHLQSLSRSRDDRTWLAEFGNESSFRQYYVLDTGLNEIQALSALNENDTSFSSSQTMRPFIYRTADQKDLVAYLTYPKGTRCNSEHPCPLAVNVHGGPSARDRIGFQKENALLSNRGYAVLNVNYRGSAGFGKNFRELSNGEWGGKMLDDVQEVSQKLLASGNFDKTRTAILGSSHGSYLALMAATDKTSLFRCAVASSSTADLETFIRFNVKARPALARYLYSSIGNPDEDAAKDKIKQRSPASRIQNLNSRLLLMHGGKDTSAPVADINTFAAQLVLDKKEFSYLVFPEASHVIQQGGNTSPYYAALLGFMDHCMSMPSAPAYVTLPASVNIRRDDAHIFQPQAL